MVSGLTFKSSTLFELRFVYSMRKCFVSVLFVTESCLTLCNLWTSASQATLSCTISWSLLKLMSVESVMLSNHLTLCDPLLLCLQSFPVWRSFPMSWLFLSGCKSTGGSAWSTVLPMNSQDWFPLGWTGWISLQSQGLSRAFSNTTIQKHQFFSAYPSLWFTSHICTRLLEKS